MPYASKIYCEFGTDGSRWFMTANAIDALLDTGKLSSNARFNFTIDTNNRAPQLTIDRASGTLSDKFYCEQAIWEASPLPFSFSGSSIELPASTKLTKHRNILLLPARFIPPQMVALRVIPASIIDSEKFPRTFTDYEIHCAHNVALLSVRNINNPRLKAYRTEWVLFISKHGATRESTIAFASSLLNKYQDLFKLADSDKFTGTHRSRIAPEL